MTGDGVGSSSPVSSPPLLVLVQGAAVSSTMSMYSYRVNSSNPPGGRGRGGAGRGEGWWVVGGGRDDICIHLGIRCFFLGGGEERTMGVRRKGGTTVVVIGCSSYSTLHSPLAICPSGDRLNAGDFPPSSSESLYT